MSNPAPTLNQINAFNATQGTTIDFNIAPIGTTWKFKLHVNKGTQSIVTMSIIMGGLVDTYTIANMANQSKSLAASKISIGLHGQTNVQVTLTSGTDHFFSGNSTNTGYINNQPVALIINSFTVNVTIPA